MNNFFMLNKLVNELNKTNSTLDKIAVLSKPEYNTTYIKEYIKAVYNPFKQYYITSANLKKRQDLMDTYCKYENIFYLLNALSSRELTGHSAISQVNIYIKLHPGYEELIYSLFDRNLKIRMSEKLINKVFIDLIPTFEVALANKYDDYKHKIDWSDGWYGSHKLDGCVHEDTIIEFENDIKKTIKDVVDNKINGKVKCFNIKNKKIEYKNIKNWFKNIEDINDKDNDSVWYEIELQNNIKIRLTGNHRVWIPKLKCWRRVDELNGNEEFLINH